ncbi:MAG: hypothetical protein MZV65_27785 [Chromatiales bacterium]|nr:hypothetical protein [Chromatiales bacterium]
MQTLRPWADAPDETPATPCLALIWVSGYSPLTVQRLTLAGADDRAPTVLAIGEAPEIDYQSSIRLALSADATRLLYFLAPRFTVNSGYADSLTNGRLYEAVMSSEVGGSLQWESRAESVQPTTNGRFTWTDANNYDWGGSGTLAVFPAGASATSATPWSRSPCIT